MWWVFILGSVFIIFFALLSMCVLAGWADEDMKRLMRGDSVECEEFFETVEETGLHDHK